MLWFSKHARYQKKLSPYIDGQLTAGEKQRLEEHLAACDACRLEIDELRSTISAVGGLPEIEPPRSFALTPAMLERGRRARPVEPAPPVAVGMRLAGAAVAVVLAVVLVGDLGIGGDMSDEQGTAGGDLAERSMNLTVAESGDSEEAPAATSIPQLDAASAPTEADATAAFGATGPCPEPDGAAAGGGTGGGTGTGEPGGPEAATTAAEPPASPQPTPDAAALAECPPIAADLTTESGASEAPAELRDGDQAEGSQPAASPADDAGDVSTLTVLEIVLAGALVALLGGIAVELLLRRHRAV